MGLGGTKLWDVDANSGVGLCEMGLGCKVWVWVYGVKMLGSIAWLYLMHCRVTKDLIFQEVLFQKKMKPCFPCNVNDVAERIWTWSSYIRGLGPSLHALKSEGPYVFQKASFKKVQGLL